MFFQSNFVLQVRYSGRMMGFTDRCNLNHYASSGRRASIPSPAESGASIGAGAAPGLIAIGVFGIGDWCSEATAYSISAAMRLTKLPDLDILNVT
jgi:hypothetical protein